MAISNLVEGVSPSRFLCWVSRLAHTGLSSCMNVIPNAVIRERVRVQRLRREGSLVFYTLACPWGWADGCSCPHLLSFSLALRMVLPILSPKLATCHPGILRLALQPVRDTTFKGQAATPPSRKATEHRRQPPRQSPSWYLAGDVQEDTLCWPWYGWVNK